MRCIALFITLFVSISSNAQILRGRITNNNGQPVHNASLFIRELRMGTAANDEGYYELRLPDGVYTCIYQSMGYETQSVVITVGGADAVVHNVVLQETAFEIPEIVVSNNRGEDPAYAIMRRAIAMAPYYLHQVSHYKAELYLKGTLHVGRISPLIRRLAKDDLEEMNIKEGNTYLEESFNEIEFTAPNIYRQNVIRKTGSLGGDDSNSNNAMTLITASIYDEKAFEPIISPLSTSSFAHYRFRYEGFFFDDDRIINKIRIIPRRNSKQLFSGYVYIADGYWNVHSADVLGELIMGIKFRMQVNFGEVNENVWMPVSYNFNFDASVLGNRGSFQYVASMKYTDLVENTSLRKPDALQIAQQLRRAQQQNQAQPVEQTERSDRQTRTIERIENLMERENLSNRQAYQLARLMQREAEAEKNENQSLDITATIRDDYKVTVDSTANERDTVFWEMMRPVPLNTEEMRSYQERDARLAAPTQRRDTIQNNNRKKTPNPFMNVTGKIFWGTTNFRLGKNGAGGTIQYRGLLYPSRLGFNTVDGFFVGQKMTYFKNFSQNRRFSVTPEVVWAIDREAVMWDVDATFTYASMRRGRANIKFGQKSVDFSPNVGILPFQNSISSLFFRHNYLKLYEDNFAEASNSIDIANGLQLYAGVKYSRRVMLDNHSDFSFFFRDERHYTLNIPENNELINPLSDHNSATLTLNVQYTPRHYYRIVGNNQKRYIRSDFPTFSVGWRKGVSGIMGSKCNFDYLALGIEQEIETGLMQEFRYGVRAGAFVNNKNVFFSDFRHFNSFAVPFTLKEISPESFKLLEYYRYSTSDKYLQAHLNYSAPFLFLKFLPWFSNRMMWRESVQLNYLYTPHIENYIEPGYTIGLLPVWEVGVFAGFENFRYRSWGIRASLGINL